MSPLHLQVVREGSKRVLNMRPFDVQLIGGVILHEGEIAEMRTGEGKTLVSVSSRLPAELHSLTCLRRAITSNNRWPLFSQSCLSCINSCTRHARRCCRHI